MGIVNRRVTLGQRGEHPRITVVLEKTDENGALLETATQDVWDIHDALTLARSWLKGAKR